MRYRVEYQREKGGRWLLAFYVDRSFDFAWRRWFTYAALNFIFYYAAQVIDTEAN